MLNDVSKSPKPIFPKEITHDFGKQKKIYLLIVLENKPEIILNTVVGQK